jgi:valyl-tRNA synthetase
MSFTITSESIPNRFDYSEAQSRIYQFWEDRGYFHSEPDPERKKFPKGPYTIVIPPPNVTGALHLGHALNNTLQDIQIRMRRMQGYNALWMPGTDHAGIATQAVVERRLKEEEGQTRHDLGREKLVERIWQWKEQYEARILGQLKQMGCSCDWQRTRFTLDETCARAVRQTFFDLFSKGLIYRGKRLVNWDTFLQTAVSDDEVFHEPVKGHFWHFQYPVIDPRPGEPTHVTIATTRPETMLGDTAVAVHPDPAGALDKAEAELTEKLAKAPAKEKSAIQADIENIHKRRETMLAQLETLRDMARDGRRLMLPLLNREIPLVADEWAKPELGSGCVKITPAHDANDYEVGLRQELPMINILNPDGTLNENAGPYKGLTVMQARHQVVGDLETQGLVVEVEDREIDLAHSDRSKTPIEPYLADQWFLKMDELAQSAMDAVSDGRVKIIPERYAKSYLDWLGEKRDWCIGRQLWWGHRVPVWRVVKHRGALIQDGWEQRNADEQTALRNGFEAYFEAAGVSRSEYAIEFPNTFEIRICAGSDRSYEAMEIIAYLKNRTFFAVATDGKDRQSEEAPRVLDEVMWLDKAAGAIRQLGFIEYIKQESDVLDTWFSSALWPHSTLGWPEKTPELAYYYPTSALITSRDIITLWVARMVLMGLNNRGDVPFREVFIHPKILDAYGETMSKSKGNGVDPLDVIDKFGPDALRYGLAYLTTETQDVRMPVQFECPHCDALIEQTKKNRELPHVKCTKCGQDFSTQWASKPEDKALPRGAVVSERFETARNFCNKLWNASRFALLNLGEFTPAPVADDELAVEDRWILSRLATVTSEVTESLEAYHYADAARALYDFAWDEFCSFYVEMLKGRFQDAEQRPVAQRVMAHTLDTLLRLLHPMIPFITEEVWQLLGKVAPQRGLPQPSPAAESIMIAAWPEADLARQDRQIESRFKTFQTTLAALRDIRARQNIAAKDPIEFSIRTDDATADLLRPMQAYFKTMANAHSTALGPTAESPPTNAIVSLPGMDIFVDLKDFINVEEEIARLEKQIKNLEGQIKSKQGKLANASFVERAPVDVVQRERDSLAQLEEQFSSARSALDELKKSQ